jgi:hypothetical protein
MVLHISSKPSKAVPIEAGPKISEPEDPPALPPAPGVEKWEGSSL